MGVLYISASGVLVPLTIFLCASQLAAVDCTLLLTMLLGEFADHGVCISQLAAADCTDSLLICASQFSAAGCSVLMKVIFFQLPAVGCASSLMIVLRVGVPSG